MRLAALSQPDARISVEGSGSIEADGKIDRLKAVVAGSGNLAVTGNADSLDLTVEGSGDATLGELVVKNADVSIEGSGDAEIAPRGASHVTITGEGSGDVTASGTSDMLKVKVRGSGGMRLGGLTAKTADVDIDGSGEVEIAPQDALNVGIDGSGGVTLRSEPKKLEASIAGSGHITHPDGTRQDRHSHERHARLEQDDFGAPVSKAAANGSSSDDDDVERAAAKLKARIQHEVAQSLAGEDKP
jgi:hypothetical protein